MKIDWNPNDSPVFRWFAAHAVAFLAVCVGCPAVVQAIAGPYAGTVQSVLGVAAATGVLGVHYGAVQSKAVAAATVTAAHDTNVANVLSAIAAGVQNVAK